MATNFVKVSPELPSAGRAANGRYVALRSDPWGHAYSRPVGTDAQNAAESDCYFIARNPTIGTGLASIAAATGVSDTEAFLHVYNSNTVASGRTIVLDYLRIQVTVAGLSGTTTGFFTKVYKKATTRYSSGGSAITEENVRMDSDDTAGASNAAVHAGAVVLAAAEGSERILSGGQLRSVIAVAGDVYHFDFGGRGGLPASLITTGTAVTNIYRPCAPVVLGPLTGFQFGLYGASQATAAQYEFELGYFEV